MATSFFAKLKLFLAIYACRDDIVPQCSRHIIVKRPEQIFFKIQICVRKSEHRERKAIY